MKQITFVFLMIFSLASYNIGAQTQYDVSINWLEDEEYYIDKEKVQENSENEALTSITEGEPETEKIDVFNMQIKDTPNSIKVDETLNSKEIKIIEGSVFIFVLPPDYN